jgi:predicted Zn finger-like uncharacterized protein
MQTRCPECHTVFQVEPQVLEIAEGRVRCARCQCVFDAHEHLFEENEHAVEEFIPTLDDIITEGEAPPEREALDSGESGETTQNATSLFHPELWQERGEERRGMRWFKRTLMGLMILLAALGLVAQLAYAFRDTLAVMPQTAELTRELCNRAEPWCEIPPRRQLEAITLASRHVVSHPNVEDALVISATFRNDAEFAQAYPSLLVSMSNVRGETVASRHFKPADYLDEERLDGDMTPGESVSFSVEVADPGSDAVAFELNFY